MDFSESDKARDKEIEALKQAKFIFDASGAASAAASLLGVHAKHDGATASKAPSVPARTLRGSSSPHH